MNKTALALGLGLGALAIVGRFTGGNGKAQAIAMARGRLAGQLGVPPDDLKVILVFPGVWANKALDVPIQEAPVTDPTPGWGVGLEYGGRAYAYRIGGGKVRYCSLCSMHLAQMTGR